MLNFFNNKISKAFQKGSAALIVIGAILIITGAAIGIFNGIVPKTMVEVEAPQTKAEQKQLIKQTKTSFGAVQGLTKNLLNLNSEIVSRSLTQEEKDLKLANLAGVAKQRKTLVKELMKENPRAFLATAIRKNQRATLPQNIQKDIEQETTITAKIEVFHIDDFENPENSRFEYTLRTKDAKLNFYPTNELHLVSGAEIKVSGLQLDDIVVSDTNKQNFQVTKESPPLESIGDQKTLVLLINFLNSPSIPFAKEQAFDMIFNDQFQEFMKEQSYGKVSFSGDVYGWITLQRNGVKALACEYTSKVSLSDTEIKNFVLTNNINLDNYDRLLFILNQPFDGGCSHVGKIDISFNNNSYRLSDAYIGLDKFDAQRSTHPFKWIFLDHLLSHELGHSLGVYHANGWDCGTQVLYDEFCEHVEYGNLFDTMGHGLYSLHFNSFYKELLGWIKPEETLIINQSGTYSISNLETEQGVKLAKIQRTELNTTPYYLEYRKGIGFDSNLNNQELNHNKTGLFFNKIITDEGFYPRLLDMNPTSFDWVEDIKKTTLNNSNIFYDPGSGIAVGPILGINDSSINFNVKLSDPVCIQQKPLVNAVGYKYLFEMPAGESDLRVIEIINKDPVSCGGSNFNIILTMPSFWEYIVTDANANPFPNNIIPPISLFPETGRSIRIDFSVPVNTPPITYSIKSEVINTNSGLKTMKEDKIDIVQPITQPDISITAPKDGDIVARKSRVNITVEVSDAIKDKTKRVEFYVNGVKKCQDKAAPYSCNWQVPKKSGQTYELQAKAYGDRKQLGVKPIAESEIIKIKVE